VIRWATFIVLGTYLQENQYGGINAFQVTMGENGRPMCAMSIAFLSLYMREAKLYYILA
jgi:hypothetical protein